MIVFVLAITSNSSVLLLGEPKRIQLSHHSEQFDHAAEPACLRKLMDLLIAEYPIVVDLVVDRANVRHLHRIPALGLVDQLLF